MSSNHCNKCKGLIKGIRLVSNVASLPSIIRKRYSQEFCRVLSIPEDKNISGEFLTSFTYLCETCDIKLEDINNLISKLDRVQVIVSEARHQIELILQTSLFDLKDHNPKITAAYSVNNNGSPVNHAEVNQSMPKLTKNRKVGKKERRKRKRELKELYGGRGVENIEVEVSPYLFDTDPNGVENDQDIKPFANANERPLIKVKDLNKVLQISNEDEESGDDVKYTPTGPKRILRSSTRPSYSKPSLTLARKIKRRRNSQSVSSNSESSYSESDSSESSSSDSEVSAKVIKKAFNCSICRAGYQRKLNYENHMKAHKENEKKSNEQSTTEKDEPPVLQKESESPAEETKTSEVSPAGKSENPQSEVRKSKRGRKAKIVQEKEVEVEKLKDPEPDKPIEKKETVVVGVGQRLTRRQMKMMGIALEAEQVPAKSPVKKTRKGKSKKETPEPNKETEEESSYGEPTENETEKESTEPNEPNEGDLIIDENSTPVPVRSQKGNVKKAKEEKSKEPVIADYVSDNESVKSPSLITAAIVSLDEDLLEESEEQPEGALDLRI